MAVFVFGQVLSLELRAKEPSTVWFLLHSDKQVFVLCKFTALHYRNTWLYSPIFPNADNCQDWLIKGKVGSVILLTCPSSHHVLYILLASLLHCHIMLIPFSNISLSYSLERWKREKFFRSLKLSLLPVVWQPTDYSTNKEFISLTSMALIMTFEGCSIFLFGFSNNGGINNISFLRYKDLFL